MTIQRTLARLAATCLAVAAGALASPSAAAEDFVVVAHPSHPEDRIARPVASSVFLKRKTRWTDGRDAVPVEPAVERLREKFAARVHGRPFATVQQFWDRQVLSGRGLPPELKASDDEVVAFVRRTPGAIGYVSPGTRTEGVKVLTVH